MMLDVSRLQGMPKICLRSGWWTCLIIWGVQNTEKMPYITPRLTALTFPMAEGPAGKQTSDWQTN
jgi:hypothetical protein